MENRSIPGVLFDGLSTASKQVVLTAMSNGLSIVDDDGTESIIPYADLSDIEKIGIGFRCSLPIVSTDGEQRLGQLQFNDSALFNHLTDQNQSRINPLIRSANKIWRLKLWQVTLIALAALSIFLYALITGLSYSYKVTPISYDIHLGKSVDSVFSSFYTPCSTPALDSFLQKAIKHLSLPSDRFRHRVIILNDSMENAIALPGGTIYLFRGLLEKSSSPDEILGVLSHEMIHGEERHTVRQIIKSTGLTYIITLGIGAAIDGFDMLDGVERTLELSSALFMLRYSRDFERQADSLAIGRLHRVNLCVGPLDSLLTRISPTPRMRDRFLALFTTHPLAEERARRFQNARKRETFKQDTIFTFERLNWDSIKKGCPAPKDSIPFWQKIKRPSGLNSPCHYSFSIFRIARINTTASTTTISMTESRKSKCVSISGQFFTIGFAGLNNGLCLMGPACH